MKKLSIVVLSYHHEKFIRENLEGIFMQKVDFPIELIISDDASKDKTTEIIDELISKKPSNIEIKFTKHQKNLGSTPNFYFALKQVSGDYIAFCEGDDYWTDPEKLQRQYDFLETNPEHSMCFHEVMNISPFSEYNKTLFSKIENRDYTPEEIYKHWIVHTASVVMRSKVLETNAFKKTMNDPTLQYFDTVLFLAASSIGKIRGFSGVMSHYRRHEQGLSFGKNLKKDLKHNHLDSIIGKYYRGKIKSIADWQIFSRSLQDFNESITKKEYGNALKFLKWMFHSKVIIYYYKKQMKQNGR